MKYLMGVDEGTTGCKAILFTDEGTQIASTAREYPKRIKDESKIRRHNRGNGISNSHYLLFSLSIISHSIIYQLN